MTEYRCIVADPPWNETGGGRIRRGADRHYPLMKKQEIAVAMAIAPCFRPPSDSHLWLWATNNHLPDALWVMNALGFRYVTNMAWYKNRFGLGYYLRGQHELCLLGVRGKLKPLNRNVPSVVRATRRVHSQKPDEAFAAIERVSPGPRLEMFARGPREGWDVWGDEA